MRRPRMSRQPSFLFLLSLAIASPFLCSAQVEQGAITGSVIDQSGASIPGAKITATNVATQAIATTETNVDGYYKIPYLLAGSYNVAVEKPGFSLAKVTGVPVLVGQSATINITLQMGTLHEEVTVTSNAVMIDQ